MYIDIITHTRPQKIKDTRMKHFIIYISMFMSNKSQELIWRSSLQLMHLDFHEMSWLHKN